MSKREDILDGTIDINLHKKYGLIYTCKCGWIDLGHLNPSNPRIEIGVENLWKQLTAEGSPLIHPRCGPARSGSNSVQTIAHYLGKPSYCSNDPYLKFSDGKTGFLVRYRQDHAGYPGKPGREGRYIVKYGLTIEQKKQVALAIFMEVSQRFERFQKMLSLVTDSGFSQEDLVSNLIGFYIGIGEIEKIAALKLCHPVSDKTAYKIWDTEGAVGQNKNTQWQPKYADSTYRESSDQCLDECALIKREFPAVFKRILPAARGLWHRELY